MEGRLWFKARGILMLPPVGAMLVCTWTETERDALLWPVGACVFAAGLFLRFWAQLHLRYRLNVKTQLTTTGPYQYVRNPIYIGNTLILVALCVLSELLWLCPLVAAYCAVVYGLAARYEERRLSAKYSQAYLSYLGSVGRWVPARGPSRPRLSVAVSRFVWPAALFEARILLLLLLPLAKEGMLGT